MLLLFLLPKHPDMQTIVAPPLQRNQRIQSIDLLRGLVMIIMALDHVRDFFHYNALINQNPLDFSTTTPALFLTRWVTHFCAPVFVFLSGTGIFLYESKGKSKKQVALFLLTRGIWLMLIEILVITPLWDFNFVYVALQVIWAIGLSMVILSVLIFLPYKILLTVGLIIVFGHNLLDSGRINAGDAPSFLWAVIHQEHVFDVTRSLKVGLHYPFLPWLGLMIVGYALGNLYLPNIKLRFRKTFLLITGISVTMLFIIIRWTEIYGDMDLWAEQKNTLFTFFDFVSTTKYPPSLMYILMTIGPALIFLSFAEKISGTLGKKIIVFGKVPFFYYILHVFLIHALSWLLFFATGHSWNDLDFVNFRNGSLPYGSGYSLWVVYAAWVTVIIILYFPCRWYSRYKATHKQWWLSYI